MKYILIAVVVVVIVVVTYQRKNVNNSTKGHNQREPIIENSDKQTEQFTPYTGNLLKIQNLDYIRYIFAKHTSENYLLNMIKEYGELSGNEEFKLHNFWLGKIGDWHVIKVDESVDFYTYHNLVGWFTGYEENPDIPEYSIGYSKSKLDSKDDYIFYLDPNIDAGDTEIGAFENGKSFFIYLPNAYEPTGNLTVTNDLQVSLTETVEFLTTNGLDIKSIESLEFTKHQIKSH
ncbi:hypothetical protein [Echinicola salinicaeni]|uniref:hypothetical protein n=1 Tax=Echinicola salinicaeni TaxID=2762757 RepID=UPI0016449FAB|nr:hypothetical protein [Echinicola salinicaeni]